MTPKGWTFSPHQPQGWTKTIGARDTPEPTMHIHLDGAGGEHSADPRLRKCGWAWIQADIEIKYGVADTIGYWGRRVTTPGKQTVPRVEIMAL